MINNYYKGRFRLSSFDNRWVFDGEFAGLAEDFELFLQLATWIKSELKDNEEALFYNLLDNRETIEML